MLQEQVRYLPEHHFEPLLAEINSKEIVFVGEVHNVPALREAAADLVVGMASSRPVVYAVESLYSLSLFYEAASLGTPTLLSPNQPVPAPIAAFNATNPPERRILMTAVDVEHAIYHSKEHPVRYLTEMANRSASASARQELWERIPQLTATKTYDEVQEYLRDLQRLFQKHLATFSAADQEEILFALELFEASNRYQHSFRGLIKTAGDPEQIRHEYFKKTIERAWQKAERRKAILIAHVGNRHVELTRTLEATYFAMSNAATKGKVMAIQMYPSAHDSGKESSRGIDLVAAVKPLMKPGYACYLALPRLRGPARRALKYSQYYPGNRPVCDGLLFVNATNSPRL